jgi:hypothetical protein
MRFFGGMIASSFNWVRHDPDRHSPAIKEVTFEPTNPSFQAGAHLLHTSPKITIELQTKLLDDRLWKSSARIIGETRDKFIGIDSPPTLYHRRGSLAITASSGQNRPRLHFRFPDFDVGLLGG